MPLRHLTYSFHAHEEGMEGGMYNGINGGVETESGVASDATSDGADGTIDVDILALDQDGSLIVRVAEKVDNEARTRQAYTCNVYGNTSVLCPNGPAPSEAEYVLLSYLGRQFVDAAPWDAQHHWERTFKNQSFDLDENFTLTDLGDGKRVKVHETKKTTLHQTGFASITDDVDIVYNRPMEVPDSIHDDSVSSDGGGHDSATFAFDLRADSLSKP